MPFRDDLLVGLNHEDLLRKTATTESSIDLARGQGLLAVARTCPDPYCARPMKEARCANKDGVRWVCTRCCKTTSIRNRSFFGHSDKSISDILRLMYRWCHRQVMQDELRYELRFKSNSTIVDWKNFCRDVCAEFFIRHPIVVGGNGVVVEIDESLLVRRKYNVGHAVNEQWVDTTTNEGFMVPADHRDAATLTPLIVQYIRPGSIICSDLWGAYNNLGNLGYQHLTVNHTTNYVDPVTGCTTNHAECQWKNVKMAHKSRCGTHRTLLDTYLQEFMWRQRFGRDRSTAFLNFIRHVRELYPF